VKILYFDCFAGAAGDMIVGALLDAGLPLDELKRALGSLAVEGWEVSADRVLKTGVTATKFRVREVAHHHGGHTHQHSHTPSGAVDEGPDAHTHSPHHSLKDIERAIQRSALSAAGKHRAIAMFHRLGEVEASIHGMTIDQVHLHEVGALDSIIDIVGAVFGIEWFSAGRIVASPLNVGGGMVRSAHGVFPVPAPATLRLLKEAPIYSTGIQTELLTPTGALILSEYASSFGPVPPMRVDRVGYGAGDRDLAETPNVVRLLVGESADDAPATRVVSIECEIDDMNPQIFGALMDRLYAAGALEVFYVAVQMKKNRPGTLMTIVARPDHRAALTELVFRETTTIGVRYQEMSRECLDREMVTVATTFGAVRFKVARRSGELMNAQPEFDDLTRLAAEHGVPVKQVQSVALAAWLSQRQANSE
jgi:pyridinium-3,5-bisthiocarboxylic acid mononucleotide nickel chelatase